ncbi:MAG: hypothetical protein HPY45_14385 [Anaerolineae bacterium]|nr:hypothetical protein [Anaerolineae bacterium]
MKAFHNLKTATKLLGGFSLVTVLLIVVAVINYTQMARIDAYVESIYADRLLPIDYACKAESYLYKMRGDVYKYVLLPDERAQSQEMINDSIAQVNASMEMYRATNLLESEKEELAKFDRAWADYQAAVAQVIKDVEAGNEQAAIQSLLEGGAASNSRKAVGASSEALIEINRAEAERLKAQADVAFAQAGIISLVIALVAVIVAFGLGLLITSSINTPLKIMSAALGNLALGDLNRDVPQAVKDQICARKDEIGMAGKGLAAAENYMLEMAGKAERIANGDLTVVVQPKSAKDELGIAFERMIAGLREVCGAVKERAVELGASSAQLSAAAAQAGQATSQIVTTLEQVARGVAQQTEATTKTAASVEQMSRAIEGVSRGAQEQASAAAKASEITTRMNSAIQQVAGNAQEVTERSAEAAEAARKGSQTVEQTLTGMQAIKQRVDELAQRVGEMGQRSTQIGAIVETIEDIASQTNLLALNAAIEAARAGEHGKGFAVVADEVRKLAERASAATKEIGGLIRSIQETVNEAVNSMELGAKDVQNGVALANEAGTALSAILDAAETVYEQAKQASEATLRMNEAAAELVSAVDSVSAVIEENTAATEQMSAGSSEVTQAIESIASVSEENSAAIEEVSASTEEMNSQVEEVSASAHELAEMAKQLKTLVARFKLSENENFVEQVEVFKEAHLDWVAKLRKMLAGELRLKEEEVASHTNCDLGKWYYGRGRSEFGGMAQFKAIEEPHTRMHQMCRQAVVSFNRGDRHEAQRIVDQLATLSREVVADLESLEHAIALGGNGHAARR